MKLRQLIELLGVRQSPRRYGYTINEFSLPGHGSIRYAQWNHPREGRKIIDPVHVKAYQRFIAPGDFCIDIGAHTGDSTLPIALAATKTGTVVALEPNPYVFPVLEKNARMNRETMTIIPWMAAVTGRLGAEIFEYSDSGFCNGGRHEGMSVLRHGHTYNLLVHGIDLQDELQADFPEELERLRFIKVDAEGFDLYILMSMRQLIEQRKPVIKAEVYKKTSQHYRTRLLRFLQECGYRVFRVAEEPCLPGEELAEENVCRWQHYDVIAWPKTESFAV